jgi:quinol monooxygenase YgiN
MSLPVLIGFAGVLVAAAATGVLAGWCFRQPRIYLILWTGATLGLAVALAAQSMGFAGGFNLATFRAVQLPTQLFAPLWLAWGLVELAGGETARFGMRLISGALTVVAGVILATDPLTGQPFSKSWPSASAYFQPISHYALDAVQVVAALAVLASVALAVARKDPRSRPELTGICPVGLAVLATIGLRLDWPDRSAYPLLSMLAAALIWFGVTRIQVRPGEDFGADGMPAGEYATYGQPRPAELRAKGAAAAGAAAAAAPGQPYGRILIFTLFEERVAEFDRLAEQTAEQVRTGEPGTLVYVIHLVPNAPLQRLFYEIYRDPAAFDSHESQPYMQRFASDSRSCVVVTNVIELRLTCAKVVPLPNSQSPGPRLEPPGPRLQPSGPRLQPSGPRLQPSGPRLQPSGPRLEPLPSSGPDRPSQLPPVGRRYGGA